LSVAGDGIRFTLKIAGGPTFGFEGKLPKEGGKNILGTISQDKQVFPAQLEPTTLKSLDSYELMKEIVATRRITFAFFNNHYAGHAPGSIELFERTWKETG